MINMIVWSKDRPAQLELLLRSINKNAPGLFRISVIYTYSSYLFKSGYMMVEREYNHQFIHETDFYDNTIDRISIGSDHIMFCTDDMIFYRQCPVTIDELSPHLPNSPSEVFSFRLGMNTIVQDCHKKTIQEPLQRHTENGKVISWCPSYYNPFSNYGYPYALDTHVFNKDSILSKCQSFPWKTTNELESGLQKFKDVNVLSSLSHSIAVNTPVNSVSGVTVSGQKHPILLDEICTQFVTNGKKINLELVEQTEVVGCHQEIELRLV